MAVTCNRPEAPASVYDATYAKEWEEVEKSFYYPMFMRVVSELKRYKVTSVLEVGCGSGRIAELIARHTNGIAYRGFDFSSVAVEMAGRRTGKPDQFFVGNAL